MTVPDAQRELRTVFLGGAVGQAVSALLWFVAAALGTQAALRLAGHGGSLSRGNPFNALAMQTAFIIPLCIPVILGATLYNADWFFPAFMVVVGAHYLAFITLYGMWQYGVLAGGLISGGLGIGLWISGGFSLGGWVGAGMLFLFSLATLVARSRGTAAT